MKTFHLTRVTHFICPSPPVLGTFFIFFYTFTCTELTFFLSFIMTIPKCIPLADPSLTIELAKKKKKKRR